MAVSNSGFKNFTRMLSGNAIDPEDQKLDHPITLSDREAEQQTAPKREECYFYSSLESDIKFKMQSLCNDSTNRSLCDAVLEIGPRRQVFHIVSALFAVHSPELDQMLKSSANGQRIVFEDLTADCFQFLRLYFYGLNPVIPLHLVSDILYAAHRLKVNPLADAVRQYSCSLTDIDDLVLVLSLLHQHDFHELIHSLISSNDLLGDSGKVFHSENLNLLSPALMVRFLESATFQSDCVLTEEAVFEKCVCWAKYNAKVREINQRGAALEDFGKIPQTAHHQLSTEWKRIIKPLLPHIRFPIMKGEYFASQVVDTNILSHDDCALIMQYLFTQRRNVELKYSTKGRMATNHSQTPREDTSNGH